MPGIPHQAARQLNKRRWDVVYLYREFLPIGPPVLERRLAATGIPIVYDFDDAIFLPDVDDANRRLGWLKWPQQTGTICRLSTQVIVGNEYLKQYALRFTPNVAVVATTIDTESYTLNESVAIRGEPVIGWSGSLTALKHLRGIEGATEGVKAPGQVSVEGCWSEWIFGSGSGGGKQWVERRI